MIDNPLTRYQNNRSVTRPMYRLQTAGCVLKSAEQAAEKTDKLYQNSLKNIRTVRLNASSVRSKVHYC